MVQRGNRFNKKNPHGGGEIDIYRGGERKKRLIQKKRGGLALPCKQSQKKKRAANKPYWKAWRKSKKQ